MNRRTFCAAATAAIPAAALSSCSDAGDPPPIPADLVAVATVPGMPQARHWGSQPAESDFDFPDIGKPEGASQGVAEVPLRVLAISGGGANAAFAAGLLTGWSKAGSRPPFQIVTGVSAGALAAPFALLGSAHDQTLRKLYTGLAATDLVRQRWRVLALFNDSLASPEPLRKLIKQYFDEPLMTAIAAEHRAGRRLIVGTTHVYAGRLVAWNIGAIADSGHPGALDLIHKVLLASAAVPIMLPPVFIEVEAAGRRYLEMHVDGGVTRQAFVAPPDLDWNALKHERRHRALEFYVIRNGRAKSEYMLMPDELMPLGEHALHLLAQAQGVGDLYVIHAQAQRAGAAYHAAWIGDEFQAPWTQWYDPPYIQALFEYGYAEALAGRIWRSGPPGLEVVAQSRK